VIAAAEGQRPIAGQCQIRIGAAAGFDGTTKPSSIIPAQESSALSFFFFHRQNDGIGNGSQHPHITHDGAADAATTTALLNPFQPATSGMTAGNTGLKLSSPAPGLQSGSGGLIARCRHHPNGKKIGTMCFQAARRDALAPCAISKEIVDDDPAIVEDKPERQGRKALRRTAALS